ncbi:MAG TPA: right-handed parallel beta-helix repeat-containing protein, partial [Microthrixaceae bacterium]|nr:right-handed parallel beta-helix repeat-containing protein [Microthrixaceae bacterium]
GSSSLVTSARPLAGSPSQVYYDGAALVEVGSLAEVSPGRFFVDYATGRLHIGSNPTGHLVEASTLEIGANVNGHAGSALRGLEFKRYATSVKNIAAVRAWSDNMIVENVTATDNAYAGISTIGNNISVLNSTMSRNGCLGGHSYQSNGLTWARNNSSGNNSEGFNVSWEAGGFKMTKSRNVVIEDSWIHDNRANGFWLDQSAENLTLRRNTISDNDRSGVMLELSGRIRVIGNLISRNGRYGLYSNNSNDIDAWNNIVVDNSTDVHLLDDRTRSITNLSSSDHDKRYPIPNPSLFWESKNIRVINNVIGDTAKAEKWASPALVAYDDNGDRYSFRKRGFEFDANRYFQRRSGSAAAFSSLDDSPNRTVVSAGFDQHRAATGMDATSQSAVGDVSPWTTGEGTTIRSAATGGRQMPSAVAADLGVKEGSRDIGIPSTVPTPTLQK